GNKNHRSKGRQVRRQFEEQRAISAHSVEMPSLTKHIENRMKTVGCFGPAKGPVLTHAALSDEPPPDNAFVISELHHIEVRFDGDPLRLKSWIARELRFDLVVFVTCPDLRFVTA